MAMSEDMYRKKMLETENAKANALRDISELLTAIATMELAKLESGVTFSNMGTIKACKNLMGAVTESIEKRWAE